MTLLKRFAVLVVLYVLTLVLAAASEDGLGPGLLLFAAYVLIALVWSAFDARRLGFRRTLVSWLLVAAATALVVSVGISFEDRDTEVLVSDLREFLPFMLGLIGVPALIGAGVGALTTRRTSSA